MTRSLFGLATCLTLAFAGRAAAEKHVYVAVGDAPCEVKVDDVVRIIIPGGPGSKVTVDVVGHGRVEGKAMVIHRAGGANTPGGITEEYEVKATRAGRIVVKVTVVPPGPGAKHIVAEHVIEAK